MSKQLTWNDVVNAYGILATGLLPDDDHGDAVSPRQFVTGETLDELEGETTAEAESDPEDCGRCEHGFACPTAGELVFADAHWETIGRVNRRAIGYIYDRQANIVYRLTASATYKEVSELMRRLIEREFKTEATA